MHEARKEKKGTRQCTLAMFPIELFSLDREHGDHYIRVADRYPDVGIKFEAIRNLSLFGHVLERHTKGLRGPCVIRSLATGFDDKHGQRLTLGGG